MRLPRRPPTRVVASALATILFYGALLSVSLHAAFGHDTHTAQDVSAGSVSSAASDSDSSDLGTDTDTSIDTATNDSSSVTGALTTPHRTSTSVSRAGVVSSKPVTIGIHDDSTAAAAAAYGVKGLGGSQMPLVQEVVNWINKNGGMGGRKLEVVPHVTDNLNGTFDQQAQEACVDFTEDHHVVAVVGGAKIPTLNLPDCLAKHKTPLVWDYDFMPDAATLDHYSDYLYMPTMVREERLGVWIDAEANRGFFNGGTIGLVRYDEPMAKRLDDQIIRPRLAAHGFKVADEVAFNPATSAGSAADLSSESSSAILRFRSKGIDRVIFEPTAGVMPLLFLAAATASGYHPRYTFTSYDVPAFQAENNARALEGSEAFGWLPAGDVAQPQLPPANPTAQLCVKITPDANPPANGGIRRYCDGLMFLKAVFDRGAEPTAAGIRRVVDSLGSSVPSAWTFTSTMTPTRHDGATVGRVTAFSTGCTCFQYVGPSIPIP